MVNIRLLNTLKDANSTAPHVTRVTELTLGLRAGLGLGNRVCSSSSSVFTLQRRIPINDFSVVCQAKFTCCIDQLTKKIPNSPARMRARHQVSLPYSSTALPRPSLPTPLVSSNSNSEGALMAEKHARRRTGKKLANRSQRTSFA
jgi:hypothetical protein